MMIYRSSTRSKTDYWCIVYNSSSSREIESLESVPIETMIIADGCFKSTPISNLQVITDEPSLQIRRDKLSLKYYYKVKSLLKNPLSNPSPQNKKPYTQMKILPLRSQSEFKKYIQD